jgi:hypothetical protein
MFLYATVSCLLQQQQDRAILSAFKICVETYFQICHTIIRIVYRTATEIRCPSELAAHERIGILISFASAPDPLISDTYEFKPKEPPFFTHRAGIEASPEYNKVLPHQSFLSYR